MSTGYIATERALAHRHPSVSIAAPAVRHATDGEKLCR
jgi:hypothetical protein